MTQEEKDLLLKDLCARLPYGVYFQYDGEFGKESKPQMLSDINRVTVNVHYEIEGCKPYLFPLSSMNLDQRIEYSKTLVIFDESHCSQTSETYDWCNKNHFDYRGLIPMGLANDATNLNIY